MTERAKIQVSAKRTVEHTDPDAAGFTKGYVWTVTDRLGEFSSACATKDEAVEYALGVARSHGYADDQIDGP